MSTKYEQLIEYIINDDEAKARELFHQIVVEKSRDIYESLIDEQDLEEVGGNPVGNMVDEISADEEGMQEDEDDDMGGDDDISLDGDDDMGDDDMGDDDMGDEHMGGEQDLESKVMDLEDALDELKAEFDALMAGENAEEHDHPGMHDMGGADAGMDMGAPGEGDEMEGMYMEAEDEDEDEDEEDLEESKKTKEDMLKAKDKKDSKKKMTEAEWIREYVEKIGDAYPGNNSETSEVGTGGSVSLNSKSIVAGKNDMGGTSQNIAKGGANADPSSTPSKKPSGLLKGGADLIGNVQNRPGSDAGKSSYKSKAGPEYTKAHGKEGQTTDGKVPVSSTSPLRRK
jgi:hypothetical protein